MSVTNIYLCGVGGQGIGVLGDILCHALCAIGRPFIGSETHGVAQRGGPVSSHIRVGESARSPSIPRSGAHLVIALERVEAMRAAQRMLAPGGTLIYIDTVLQPLAVRADDAPCPSIESIEQQVVSLCGTCRRLHIDDPRKVRLQNIGALAHVASLNAVEGLTADLIRRTVEARVPPQMRARNLEVFDEVLSSI